MDPHHVRETEVGGVVEDGDAGGGAVDGGGVIDPTGGFAPDEFRGLETFGIAEDAAAVFAEVVAEAEAEAAVVGVAEGQGDFLVGLDLDGGVDSADVGNVGDDVALADGADGGALRGAHGEGGFDGVFAGFGLALEDEAGGFIAAEFAPEIVAVDDTVSVPEAAVPGVIGIFAGEGFERMAAGKVAALDGAERVKKGLVPIVTDVERRGAAEGDDFGRLALQGSGEE